MSRIKLHVRSLPCPPAWRGSWRSDVFLAIPGGWQHPPQAELGPCRQLAAMITPAHRRTDHADVQWQGASVSGQVLVDLVVSAAVGDLWLALADPEAALLKEFHHACGDVDVLSTPPHLQPGAVSLTLRYSTPLTTVPFGPRWAHNTEVLRLEHHPEETHFTLEAVCSSEGVPLSNCFTNQIRWRVEPLGAGRSRVLVTGQTKFHTTALGPLKSTIERESARGMQNAYFNLHALLAARWPASTAANTGPAAHASPPVSNRRSAAALAAGPDPPRPWKDPQSTSGPWAGAIDIQEAALVELEDSETEGEGDDAQASALPEEEDEGPSSQVSVVVYRQLKHLELAEIKEAVAQRWPQWARYRYRLVTPSDAYVADAPSPDEALGVLRAILLCARKMSRVFRLSTYPRDALVMGAVEALRLTPPRGRQPGSALPAADGEVPALSGTSMHLAFSCLATIGKDLFWKDEMEALCVRLPDATFTTPLQVYHVVEGLVQARHWTCHLALLEQRTAAVADVNGRKRWRALTRCMQGLVTLGHTPDVLFSLAERHMEENWDWAASCRLGWCLALTNRLDGPVCAALMRGIVLHSANEEYWQTRQELDRRLLRNMLWQFCLTLQQVRPEMWAQLSTASPQVADQLARAQAAWEKSSKRLVASAVQTEVYYVTQSLGLQSILESDISGLSVDIVVAAHNLAIEVDGPTHFARNRPELNIGNTLWKSRVLEAAGWDVVHVNTADWAGLTSPLQRRQFLRDAIRKQVGSGRRRDSGGKRRKEAVGRPAS